MEKRYPISKAEIEELIFKSENIGENFGSDFPPSKSYIEDLQYDLDELVNKILSRPPV